MELGCSGLAEVPLAALLSHLSAALDGVILNFFLARTVH